MIILLFHPDFHSFERYQLELFEPMPYTYGNALTVSAFRGTSRSSILWTTKPAMDLWMRLWQVDHSILPVHAFCRIGEGQHVCFSQHYTGEAFDCPTAAASCSEAHPDSFHIAVRRPEIFPPLHCGCVGVFVLVLQDALTTLGFDCAALDGHWGALTERAVAAFSNSISTPYNNIITPQLWKRLLFLASGAGIKNYITN